MMCSDLDAARVAMKSKMNAGHVAAPAIRSGSGQTSSAYGATSREPAVVATAAW